MIKTNVEMTKCFFTLRIQYTTKIKLATIKMGTNKLKIAKVGNVIGEIYGNK